jgi:amino acid transporter
METSADSLIKEIDELLQPHATPLEPTVDEDVQSPQTALQKTMGMWSGVALIVSSIIGSGIFASPGPVLKYTGSVGMALLTWLFAGLLALSGALCYAELGSMFPVSGGEHPYLMKVYGSIPAFLFSWTGAILSRPASIAIITSICAEYAGRLIYYSHSANAFSPIFLKIISLIIILLLTAINCLSTRLGNALQNVCTVMKVTEFQCPF